MPWRVEKRWRDRWSSGKPDEGRHTRPADLRLEEVCAEQWEELAAVRLKALADAPGAFLAVIDQEQSWKESEWRRAIENARWVAARSAGVIIGVARSSAGDVPTQRHIEAVWVEPSWRRNRVASRLVHWLIEKERETNIVQEMLIWVIDSNKAARQLYEELGFTPTGESPQPIKGRGAQVEERLRLPIADC